MAVKIVEGGFEYQAETQGQAATLAFKMTAGALESWSLGAEVALQGDESVLRYEGLTIYLKLRDDASRWMLARPDSKTLVATLSLTRGIWEEILRAFRARHSLDLGPRMDRRPWNNLNIKFLSASG